MIGTRILKIDLEIAEIIEVKIATFNIEIIFLPLCNSKISISKMRGGDFVINYLSYFWNNFQNSCAYHVANFLNFSKLPQHLHFGWILFEKMAKNKMKSDFWDTLYIYITYSISNRDTFAFPLRLLLWKQEKKRNDKIIDL